MVSVYVFSPVYLRLLGGEAYGVIGFYTLLFSIISFADSGISSSINREFAKSGDNATKRSLLALFERLYAMVCLLAVLAILLLAPWISKNFLNSNGFSAASLVSYVRLIGIGVGAQLMTSLYFGGLMGLQRQVSVNLAQAGWSLFRSGLVILPLYLFRANLEVFLFWTIAANVCYLLVLRAICFRALATETSVGVMQLQSVDPQIWKYVRGMLFISLLSALNFQVDKIYVSKYFRLEEYGYYNLSSVLAQIPLLATMPIAFAVFPLLTKAYSEHRIEEVKNLVRKYSFLTNGLAIPICINLALYGGSVYRLWVGSKTVAIPAQSLNQIISSLSIGNSLQAVQVVPFYFLLAAGKTKYTLRQTAIQLIIMVPLLFFARKYFGISGMGLPWAAVNVLTALYLWFILHRLLLGAASISYYRDCILLPLVTNLMLAGIFYLVMQWSHVSDKMAPVFAITSGSGMLLINFALFKKYLAPTRPS